MLLTIECVTAGQRSQTRYLISHNPTSSGLHASLYAKAALEEPHNPIRMLKESTTPTFPPYYLPSLHH